MVKTEEADNASTHLSSYSFHQGHFRQSSSACIVVHNPSMPFIRCCLGDVWLVGEVVGLGLRRG